MMALQRQTVFDTGVTAPKAYHVIMQATINKAANRVDAEVWVYYDIDARLANRAPLDRFKYSICDNATQRQDTTWHLHVYRQGDITIKLGEDVIVSTNVTDETLQSATHLQDIAKELQHELLLVTAQDNKLIVKATDDLEGSAGAALSIHGNATQIYDWTVGSDAQASDMDAFTPEALSAEGVNLQQQIYEHMKAKDPRYVDAIDV